MNFDPAAWGPIAGQLISMGAPVLGRVLGGPAGGVAGDLIGSILGQALGVPATPAAIGGALTADPAAVAKITAAEAAHADAMSEFEASLKDIEDARNQTVDLAKADSPIAWGAPVVSVIVTIGFTSITGWAVLHGVSQDAVTQLLVGVFATSFANVVGYWLGSSYGSHAKDATITAMAKR